MLEVAHDDRQKDFRTIEEVLARGARQAPPSSRSRARSLTGTPSGFKDLDEITGGFQPGNLIIIAARPSMGKCALVTQHRRERRARPRQARSRCSRSRCPRPSSRSASSPRRRAIKGDELRKGRVGRAALAEDPRGRRASSPPRRCSSTTPRDIGMLEIRAKARRLHQQCERRPRADHRRLPAADAHRRRIDSRVAAGRRDQPRAEDPRARARASR